LGLYTIGAIVGLVIAGRFLINPLFRVVGRVSERELFVVAGLFTGSGERGRDGVAPPVDGAGAFVAGVMLADSPYRHELEVDIEPFRSILLGLFFVADRHAARTSARSRNGRGSWWGWLRR
jgi:glutathione-regulated potassium-efflux system protein KefB